MRLIAWLLLAAFLLLVGAYPGLAASVGDLAAATVGLAHHGASQLLAQPAILGLVLAGLALVSYRNRRTT